MSTGSRRVTKQATQRSIAGFFLGVGVACAVAAAVGGHVLLGIVLLAVLAACAAVLFLLIRRSENVRGLTGGTDERFASIGTNAWAGVGIVLLIANLGGVLGELASGGTGSPFFWMVIAGAVAYIVVASYSLQRPKG